MDNQKEQLTFFCRDGCNHVWQTTDWQLADGENHTADCPICDAAGDNVSWRMMNLSKAWNHATGPRTSAGKSRSRLNGWKHGGRSQAFPILAPALPGKFPACESCEFRTPCETEPYKYCPVLIGPMVAYVQAFQEGNLDTLREFAGLNQARALQVIQMMFMGIQEHGVLVKEQEATRNGTNIRYKANPLLNKIPDYFELLGHTAGDQLMTPRGQENNEAMKGYLGIESDKQTNIGDFITAQKAAMHGLQERIRRAQIRTASDPALKQYAKEIEYTEVDEENSDKAGE